MMDATLRKMVEYSSHHKILDFAVRTICASVLLIGRFYFAADYFLINHSFAPATFLRFNIACIPQLDRYSTKRPLLPCTILSSL